MKSFLKRNKGENEEKIYPNLEKTKRYTQCPELEDKVCLICNIGKGKLIIEKRVTTVPEDLQIQYPISDVPIAKLQAYRIERQEAQKKEIKVPKTAKTIAKEISQPKPQPTIIKRRQTRSMGPVELETVTKKRQDKKRQTITPKITLPPTLAEIEATNKIDKDNEEYVPCNQLVRTNNRTIVCMGNRMKVHTCGIKASALELEKRCKQVGCDEAVGYSILRDHTDKDGVVELRVDIMKNKNR